MAMQRSEQQQQQPRRAMTTWTPFREMERMMDDMWQGWPGLFRRTPMEGMTWMPSIDVYDQDDSIVVKAEIPGMKKEDINVSVMGDTLTISGERKTENNVKEENYFRSEMSYGKFSRMITLPSEVDAGKVKATYENGILEINAPKVESAKAKKVEISVK